MMTILMLIISVSSIALAQENDRFATSEDCVAAIKSGHFADYMPSYTSNHREPRDGEEIRPLEERACVDLHIVGGRGVVPQAKGERYIFKGSQIVARYDCGNDARSIEYVPEELLATVEEQIEIAPHVPILLTELQSWIPFEIPPLPPPPPPGLAVALIWDEVGKRWYWKYTPLWCVDIRGWKDVYRPIVCGGLAAGGYWAAGGFHMTHLLSKLFGDPAGAGKLP